ncbi:MAG: hypothetical protein RLZZ241_317 [Bacteroidota bacterium]|jgi:3-dehydroquinate synthase
MNISRVQIYSLNFESFLEKIGYFRKLKGIMEAIKTESYAVHFSNAAYVALGEHFSLHKYSGVFLLMDTNTANACFPVFVKAFPEAKHWTAITIPAGESYKTIESCMEVWTKLSDYGADRKSLIINLGGGVVTDLGGFVASTYQRGINFINIPTTLLAMVDASIGGKTGVDLGGLKNQIGVINQPQMVLVDEQYLKTLSQRERRSGFAEMLKHGLIQNSLYWKELLSSNYQKVTAAQIHTSVNIKNRVVLEDPTEQNLRKILNFGHTLGHAVESYYLNSKHQNTLLHGEAIAVGMVLEAYLSVQVAGLAGADCDAIKEALLAIYSKVHIPDSDRLEIIKLLRYDKKNAFGKVYFSLLDSLGSSIFNLEVTNEMIAEAFSYYAS